MHMQLLTRTARQGVYAAPGQTITLGEAVARASHLPMNGWWATLGMLVQPAFALIANVLLVFAMKMMAGEPCSLPARSWHVPQMRACMLCEHECWTLAGHAVHRLASSQLLSSGLGGMDIMNQACLFSSV